jgi:hypothetical protein
MSLNFFHRLWITCDRLGSTAKYLESFITQGG